MSSTNTILQEARHFFNQNQPPMLQTRNLESVTYTVGDLYYPIFGLKIASNWDLNSQGNQNQVLLHQLLTYRPTIFKVTAYVKDM